MRLVSRLRFDRHEHLPCFVEVIFEVRQVVLHMRKASDSVATDGLHHTLDLVKQLRQLRHVLVYQCTEPCDPLVVSVGSYQVIQSASFRLEPEVVVLSIELIHADLEFDYASLRLTNEVCDDGGRPVVPKDGATLGAFVAVRLATSHMIEKTRIAKHMSTGLDAKRPLCTLIIEFVIADLAAPILFKQAIGQDGGCALQHKFAEVDEVGHIVESGGVLQSVMIADATGYSSAPICC